MQVLFAQGALPHRTLRNLIITHVSEQQLPTVSFETFVLSLGTATLVALGEIENPVTRKKEKDLQAAKQHIDILEMLQTKTQGNLTAQEQSLLNEIVYTSRMKFVNARA